MCLSVVWTDEEMEAWLAEQPEVIEVEKYVCVARDKTHYINLHHMCSFGCSYADGFNKAEAQDTVSISVGYQKYWPNFHFDLRNKSPFPWRGCTKINCLIKKEWVTAVGKELDAIVLVAKYAIFPHYPLTEASYKDIEPFLQKDEVAECDLKKEAALAAAGEKE